MSFIGELAVSFIGQGCHFIDVWHLPGLFGVVAFADRLASLLTLERS
jgi:hypothetical protein